MLKHRFWNALLFNFYYFYFCVACIFNFPLFYFYYFFSKNKKNPNKFVGSVTFFDIIPQFSFLFFFCLNCGSGFKTLTCVSEFPKDFLKIYPTFMNHTSTFISFLGDSYIHWIWDIWVLMLIRQHIDRMSEY